MDSCLGFFYLSFTDRGKSNKLSLVIKILVAGDMVSMRVSPLASYACKMG